MSRNYPLLGQLLAAGIAALVCLALIRPAIAAGNSLSNPISSLDSGLAAPLEFLPVEEAYRLFPGLEGETLTVDWMIAPGYYLYKHRFAITAASSASPASGESLALQFEPGRMIYDEYYEKDLEVYYQRTRVSAVLPERSTDKDATYVVSVTSQGCADAGLCYPPRTDYLEVNLGQQLVTPLAAPPVEVNGQPFDAAPVEASSTPAPPYNLLVILFFALAGGVILNLMPCVFPVLSIKVMSTTAAHLGAHNKHLHSLAYTAGIILSFMAIAAAMLALRASGEAVGWGFQLQSPVFVALLAYLMFAIGQSFSGQLAIGARWMNIGQNFTRNNRVSGSFMTGVLATVVASPCTAPFMGTALGLALTQSTAISLGIFAALGLGMALPFLILSWLPGLMEKLPAPGPWMNTFSQLLAFPLYATVIWLLWVLGRQTSIDHAVLVSLGILLIAFAIWLHNRPAKILTRALGAVALAGALGLATVHPADSNGPQVIWQPYSAARLTELRQQGQAVFVNLTADWCITCLANEKIALDSDAFRAALRDRNITYLKGDWTNRNPEITDLLNAHGRTGVPLYLYYDAAGNAAKILPQLLTENIVLKAFGQHGS